MAVDVQGFKGIARDGGVDSSVAPNLCEVAHAAQQGIGDTWRAARTPSYLHCRLLVDGLFEDARRAEDDAAQGVDVVVLEMEVDAEACAQGSREESAAGGGSDEGEGVEVYLNAACAGSAVNHDVDAVVLHGGVEIFLHYGRETVYLVYEEYVVRLQRGEDAREVTGLVEHRPAGELETHTEFIGYDVGQRGLAEAGWAVEQGVVERLTTVFCCLDEHFQVADRL